MTKEHIERYSRQVRAIVVFGDIRGFSVWEQSVTKPETEFMPLMNSFDSMVDEFEAKTGYFTKNLGDGFLQVIELPVGHACGTAARVLQNVTKFCGSVQRMIRESPWPRPEGFRVRIACGHIWKKEGKKTDYVGRHVNLTHKMLRVSPENELVAHQSFVELFKKNHAAQCGVKFTPLPADRRTPDGILRADMLRFWVGHSVKK